MKSFVILFSICLIMTCQPGLRKQESEISITMSDTGMKIIKTEQEWKEILTEEQYAVLREKETEKPYTGIYYKNTDAGVYICAGCGAELFSSADKFDAGCGWPSFSAAIENGSIFTSIDTSFGMIRTEITCARCGGHLGHLFDDGPKPSGLRYCVNSASMGFIPADKYQLSKDTL